MNGSLPVAVAGLLVSALVIYLASEYFVNGVEWIGRKMGFSQTAVGAVLAAFGTALPESVVTFVAVALGHDAATRDIGIGAALGGPLVLSTIAYPVVGAMLWLRRSIPGHPSGRVPTGLDLQGSARDQGWFLLIFICEMALGFVAFSIKSWLGWLFLAAYAAYTWTQVRRQAGVDEGAPEPLKFQPRQATPHLLVAGVQTLLALAFIFAASHVFVDQLRPISVRLGIPSMVVALLLSPVATELPEIMNAIIWIRQGKYRMALSNIGGAMVIQATVPAALGLFFTPWILDDALALAAAVTVVAIAAILLLRWRNALTPLRLALLVLLYPAFVIGLWLLWRSGHFT